MTANDDFHSSVKPWSKTKNALLANYLTPYFSKIMSFPTTVAYADCFAGVGKLEDGTEGSPLIALKCFTERMNSAGTKPGYVLVFSEKKKRTFEKLMATITESEYYDSVKGGCNIINGDYSNVLEEILAAVPLQARLFFYLDPFGVKDLSFSHFTEIAHRAAAFAPGTEILLNFSSPGFLREACCACKLSTQIPDDYEYVDEGFNEDISENERLARLSDIAGGDWWLEIIAGFKKGHYGFWDAEKTMSEKYCDNLRSIFAYVTNMPIRDKEGQRRVKYRMIHATNHPAGCTLMNDNMLKRKDELQQQTSLFPVDFEYVDIEERLPEIEIATKCAVESLEEGKYFKFETLTAKVISKVGVVLKSTELNKVAFAKYFDDGVLERKDRFRRDGKPRNTWTDDTIIRKVPTPAI